MYRNLLCWTYSCTVTVSFVFGLDTDFRTTLGHHGNAFTCTVYEVDPRLEVEFALETSGFAYISVGFDSVTSQQILSSEVTLTFPQ